MQNLLFIILYNESVNVIESRIQIKRTAEAYLFQWILHMGVNFTYALLRVIKKYSVASPIIGKVIFIHLTILKPIKPYSWMPYSITLFTTVSMGFIIFHFYICITGTSFTFGSLFWLNMFAQRLFGPHPCQQLFKYLLQE